jgi:DNA-binding NarL/FixJ family response regulator
VRVVIADDSGIFRHGLRLLLESAGVQVLRDVDSAESLIDAVDTLRPDACVVDIRMPPTHTDEGVRAAEHIRTHWPEVGVLVLSTYLDAIWAARLLGDGGGGVGYLLKDRVNDGVQLLDALRRIADGGTAVDPEIVAALVSRPRKQTRLDALTDREREILALMAEGKTNLGISKAVFLSPKTIETHVASIFTKLGLTTDGPPTDNRRVLAILTFLKDTTR